MARHARLRSATRPIASNGADLRRSFACSPLPVTARSEAQALDDDQVVALLSATDPESIAMLALWLKVHARSWVPLVAEGAKVDPGLSAEAACAVLGAYLWRAPVDEETIFGLMETCLDVISSRITASIEAGVEDDALVDPAVAVLTANRRSKPAETAIARLAESGVGGSLVLARAFDAVRGSLKVCILKHLDPEQVLLLGDNVVASLAASATRLEAELEGPPQRTARRFIEALGPVTSLEEAEIVASDPLPVGASVFHASWGAGTVISVQGDTATIDFGNAGTRTLLRELATLRRGA